MKLVKSLLLASAAGLVGAASAQAADLPSKKAAPAEYVKVCSAHGEGFFYIPGTDTCLKIGGYVRADYTWENATKNANWAGYVANRIAVAGGAKSNPASFAFSSRSTNQSGFTVRARTTFDARSTTEYGTLRGFISVQWETGSGNNVEFYSRKPNIDKAFIQWAGITAGHAQSMFDYYADSLGYDDLRGPDQSVNLLAYTATFGGGFSATISLEDTDQSSSLSTTPVIGSVAVNAGKGTLTSWGLQGTRQPDVVGAIGVEQAWGGAQLSGLYHSQNVEASTGVAAAHKNQASWGVNGGVHVKLPMIAPGDELWLQATYFKGDLGRQTQGYLRGWGSSATNNWQLPDYDAVVVNGSVKQPTSWVGILAFQHQWSAQWASHIEASYINVIYPGAAKRPVVSSLLGTSNWNEWRVGAGTDWTPVKNLLIGLELYYTHLDQKAPLLANGAPFTGAGGVPFKKHINGYEGILRIQRSF